MKRWKPLQRTVVIALIFVGSVLIAATAIESAQRSGEIVAAAITLQEEVAQSAASKVRRFVGEIERSMQSSAQSAAAAIAGLTELFRLELLDLLRAAPAVTAASALDLDGLEVASVERERLIDRPNPPDGPSSIAFQRARTGDTYYGRIYFVRDSEPYMTIAIPIEGVEREAIGVLVAEIRLRDLADTVSEIAVGRDGYGYLVSGEGDLIAHPDISLVLQRQSLAAIDQAQDAIAGTPTPFRPLASIPGGDVYATHAPISDLGWSVIIEQPVGEVRGPLVESISRIVLLLLVALVVLAGVGVLFSRRFIRPVGILREGAVQMGGGEFGQPISVGGSDEFGDIAETLNKLAKERRDLDSILAEQVDRRAGELQAALFGLAAFSETVGTGRSVAEDTLSDETSHDHGGGQVAEAITLLEGALAKENVYDQRLLVALETALCRAYVRAARPQDALRAYERAVNSAEGLDDESVKFQAWYAITSARSFPDLLAARLSAANQAIALVGDKPWNSLVGDLAVQQIPDLVEAGSLGKARMAIDISVQRFPKATDSFLPMRGQHLKILLAMQTSVGDEVELAIDQARDEGLHLGFESAEGVHALQIFTIRREQGRVGELEPALKQLHSDGDETFVWGPAIALLNSDGGATRAARAEFEKSASAGFDRVPRDDRWPLTITHLAEVCAYLGDDTRALALYQLLQPFGGHNIVTETICLGAADRYLGMLSAIRADWTAAERHYEKALAFNESSDLPIWHAHTRFDLAKTLLERRGEGNQKRATELLDEVVATAATLNLAKLRDDCLSFLSEKPSEGPLADGLSPRELRVLRLLASGATNRAIGEKLFVSQHTVASHVRNILGKTNSANRTEAANYALHHGLVVDE